MGKWGAAVLVALFFVARADAQNAYAPASISLAQLFERNAHSQGTFETGVYHSVSRSVSARGDVWISETFRSGRDYRTTVTEGGYRWASGSYQGRKWHADANGMVMPSANFPAQADPFLAALRRSADPSSGVELLGITAGATAAYVVDVRPRKGLTERRYYDAQTYLLNRIEVTDYSGHKRVWEYGDYRPVLGRMLAHRIDYKADGTSVTIETTVLTYERITSEPLDLSVPASRPLFDLGNRDSVIIPAQFTESGIIVQTFIGGRGLDFLLDSGSSELLIDATIAGELGMTSTGALRASLGGDFVVANARAPEFSVAGLTATNVAFWTAAFEEQLPGQRIVGLLGTDFIASGALEVNFQKKSLTLFRSLPPGLAAEGWSMLPLRLDYSVPLVKAAYSGLPGYFVADLGAVYSVLYPHYFSQFAQHIPAGTPDQGELAGIAGKPFGIKHITMRRLVLGDWVFGDAQVVVPSAEDAQSLDFDGLIGRDTLGSFNLIFDYNDAQLWFKPIDFK